MAKEHLLWQWMRRCAESVDGLDMHRVENVVVEGYPDVQLCYRGDYADVELKGALCPAGEGAPVAVSFRPAQIPWLMRRQAAGGRAWCYLRLHAGGNYLLRPDHLFEVAAGATVDRLRALSPLPPKHSFREFLEVAVAPVPRPERYDDDAWKRRRIDCLRTLCAGA